MQHPRRSCAGEAAKHYRLQHEVCLGRCRAWRAASTPAGARATQPGAGAGSTYPIISGLGMISKSTSGLTSVNLGARPKSLRSRW